MNAMFEDRLLDELKREVVLRAATAGPAATAHRRVVTPRRAALALAACGAAAALAVALPGSGTAPAYAVDTHPDGTVTLTLEDITLSGPQQRDLVRELTNAGVYAQVNEVPTGKRCATPVSELAGNQIIRADPGPGAPKDTQKSEPWHHTLRRGDTVRIDNTPHGAAYTFLKGKASPCELEPID